MWNTIEHSVAQKYAPRVTAVGSTIAGSMANQRNWMVRNLVMSVCIGLSAFHVAGEMPWGFVLCCFALFMLPEVEVGGHLVATLGSRSRWLPGGAVACTRSWWLC